MIIRYIPKRQTWIAWNANRNEKIKKYFITKIKFSFSHAYMNTVFVPTRANKGLSRFLFRRCKNSFLLLDENTITVIQCLQYRYRKYHIQSFVFKPFGCHVRLSLFRRNPFFRWHPFFHWHPFFRWYPFVRWHLFFSNTGYWSYRIDWACVCTVCVTILIISWHCV